MFQKRVILFVFFIFWKSSQRFLNCYVFFYTFCFRSDTGRIITQFGSQGKGESKLVEPRYVACDSQNNIIVSDGGDCSVKKFSEQVSSEWMIELKIGSVAQWFGASFLRRPWSQGWRFNYQPSFVVASLDKVLHDDYLCLVESGKQQIEKVRSKIQPENSETNATPKRVWIRFKHSASAAFSW